MAVRYSLLILTHNRREAVRRCFESLQATLERKDVQCWVLDNASDDGTLLYLHSEAAPLLSAEVHPFRLLRSGENLGVAGGRAELLKCATGEIVVFLDSDVTIIDQGWLDKLGKALEPENVGLVGPGGSMMKADWSGFTAGAPGEVDCVAGFCQAFKREVLELGVALDLEYGQFWTEDSDFCLQIREAGYDIMCVPVGVLHSPGHSGDADGLEQRNLARFCDKWRGKGLVKAEGGY